MLKRLLSLLMGLIFLGGQPTVPSEGAQLNRFYYQYNGMVWPLFSGIDAELTPDGWMATFLLGATDDAEGVPLTDRDVAALNKLMEDHRLWAWAGFDESDSMVLDGEGFTFSAGYSDGTRIDAQGNNSFPKDYWAAKDAILSAVEEMMIAHGIDYIPD